MKGHRRRNDEGAVFVEVVVCFIPMMTLILGIVQLSLLFSGKLLVQYAAYTAARTAAVILPDGDDEDHDQRPDDAPDAPGGSLYSAQGERLDLIETAAAYAVAPLSPTTDEAGEQGIDGRQYAVDRALDVRNAGGGLLQKIGPKFQFAKRIISVDFPNGDSLGNQSNFELEVTFPFRCSIPLVSAIVCEHGVEGGYEGFYRDLTASAELKVEGRADGSAGGDVGELL